MMKKVDFPIPTQIIEIIGEQNVADIYEGESLEENSDVEVWNTNVKAFRAYDTNTKNKRKVIHNHLKTIQAYYLSKQQKKSQSVHEGGNKSTEVESGYDSKDAVLSSKAPKRTTLRRTKMPRATSPCSPSSQSDMFSTRSPAKVNTVKDSTPKKIGVRTRSVMKKGIEPKIETSSSEDESESERIPRINISPFVNANNGDTSVSNQHSKNTVGKRDHSASESDSGTSDENEIPEHKQPPYINPKTSSDSYSSSNPSDNGSEKSPRSTVNEKDLNESDSDIYSSSSPSDNESKKSPRPTVKEKDLNESDSDGSEADSTNQGSVHQAKSSCSDSDQSEREIIPATQDVSQGFKTMSLSGSGVGNSKGTSFGSPLKPLKRENRSSSQGSSCSPKRNDCEASKTVHSSSPSKSQPIEKSRRGSITSDASDSEDDEVLKKASLTNVPSTSNIPIPQRAAESSCDDSDSSDTECSTKNNKETTPQGIVSKSVSHSSDSEDTDDTTEPDLSNPPSTKSTEKGPSSTVLKVDGNVVLPNRNSNDSGTTSESDGSDQEASTNAKVSLSPIKNQAILPRGQESRGNSSSDSDDSAYEQLRQQSTKQLPVSHSNNSRKRKADSISSSAESDNAPKIKVRKTIGTTENVPFNSTRNPEVDETSFPGSDISVIPRMKEPPKSAATVTQDTSSTNNLQNTRSVASKPPSASPTKGPGSRLPRVGQLSIREFAKPINPVSQIGTQNKYEALKQEYFDAGFSNLKEQYDFESYEGLLEEDLQDNDIEVYVVQCPKEVDPISLVDQEIDVSNKESVVELAVTGGKTVRHDVYCDLSDSEFGVNVVVPSRTKKQFTLTAVPVSGRLTIVESVDVPQIDEFDSSSPPPVPFPENLKARNTFVESDESTTKTISKKSDGNKSRKAGNSDDLEPESFILDTYETPKYESVYKDGTPGQKLKSRNTRTRDHGKLDGIKIHDVPSEEPLVNRKKKHESEEPYGVPVEEPVVERKKKKKKKEHQLEELKGSTESLSTVKEVLAPPIGIPVEEPIVKKKKKKRELEEQKGSTEPLPTMKDELQPPIGVPVEEPIVKKKKKKKRELEELNESTELLPTMKEEFQPPIGIPVEEPIVKKKKKKRELEEQKGSTEPLPTMKDELQPPIGVPVEEPIVKKKKKKKRELEELNESTELLPTMKEEFQPPIEEPCKKKKKKRHLDERCIGSTESLPTVKEELPPPTEEPREKKKKKHHLDEHSLGVDFNSDEDVTSKKKKKKKKHKKENRMDED